MSIKATQYLFPNGEARIVSIDRPAEIEVIANAFISAGGWFEIEVTSEDIVHMAACMIVDLEPMDIEEEWVPNGPEVPDAVDRLVQKAILKVKRE